MLGVHYGTCMPGPAIRRLLVALIVGVGFLGGGECDGQEAALPIKGLRIPLKLFEDGRVKMQFTAEQARTPDAGAIQATGAKVDIFDEGGAVATRMQAETCRFSRATGLVQSDGAVRLDRADLEITGVGMEWQTGEEKLTLLSKVRVVLKGGGGLGKVLPASRAPSGKQRRNSE